MDSLFFVLSKLYWVFGKPDTLLLILLTLTTLVIVIGSPEKKSSRFLALIVFVLWLIATLPLTSWLFGPLEKRFERPQLPAESAIGGVIVLGGAEYLGRSSIWGSLELNEMGERILEMNRLLHHYPTLPFVYSSGSGSALEQGKKGADFVEAYFAKIELSERVIFERESRNTYENVLNSKHWIAKTDKPWLLVTSAFHLPRAVGISSKQGVSVIPYPVDYWSTPVKFDSLYIGLADNLVSLNMAIREWTGLTVYWLTGKTSSWFPSEKDLLETTRINNE